MVYLLPFLAIGFGYIIALIMTKKKWGFEQYMLSFSGAFLLSITLFELLPEVFEESNKNTSHFIMGGIVLQIMLDFITKGAEHGHIHSTDKKEPFPWLLFIGLSIHSIIEGFPITENIEVLWGVVIHKIPIAIILSLFFIRTRFTKINSIAFLLLFACMTPVGSVIANNTSYITHYTTEINAIAIGVFLHVSTTILFESSKDHKFNLLKLSTILIGILLAYLL